MQENEKIAILFYHFVCLFWLKLDQGRCIFTILDALIFQRSGYPSQHKNVYAYVQLRVLRRWVFVYLFSCICFFNVVWIYIFFSFIYVFGLDRHVITALTVQPFEANSVCDYGLTLILFSCWTINDGRANANQMEWHVAVVVVMQFHCAFNFKWIPNSVTSKVPLDHHTCPPVFFMMGTINVETIHSPFLQRPKTQLGGLKTSTCIFRGCWLRCILSSRSDAWSGSPVSQFCCSAW